MTTRNQFAAAALQGLVVGTAREWVDTDEAMQWICETAFKYADAMEKFTAEYKNKVQAMKDTEEHVAAARLVDGT